MVDLAGDLAAWQVVSTETKTVTALLEYSKAPSMRLRAIKPAELVADGNTRFGGWLLCLADCGVYNQIGIGQGVFLNVSWYICARSCVAPGRRAQAFPGT
jgi:hypothetical protein